MWHHKLHHDVSKNYASRIQSITYQLNRREIRNRRTDENWKFRAVQSISSKSVEIQVNPQLNIIDQVGRNHGLRTSYKLEVSTKTYLNSKI